MFRVSAKKYIMNLGKKKTGGSLTFLLPIRAMLSADSTPQYQCKLIKNQRIRSNELNIKYLLLI